MTRYLNRRGQFLKSEAREGERGTPVGSSSSAPCCTWGEGTGGLVICITESLRVTADNERDYEGEAGKLFQKSATWPGLVPDRLCLRAFLPFPDRPGRVLPGPSSHGGGSGSSGSCWGARSASDNTPCWGPKLSCPSWTRLPGPMCSGSEPAPTSGGCDSGKSDCAEAGGVCTISSPEDRPFSGSGRG